ncbi:MAG: cAMP receptor protein [Candidatus Aerophobetes bacterium ADurb.Bin490]|nr:MAG: cAMP receptor protein [Candidatus Aerophobetes bacterium ADurb.Bin490]HPI02436.1 cyclic nucleotide-binding domain-containing protein [Candidatus Goldiibacteriota bacterium]HPN65489.1 cyclic nucleotide-binding domain-containing protein [Candidatus Goldiibacteriota bacterium]HRQ43397.1 cyclic nucleotide-binding domain-containing protein [Candidatus Goldiibacteriota bacterium]
MVKPEVLKKLEFFKGFTEGEIKVFSERLIIEEFESGHDIFHENQIGDDSMFIIIEGAIKISKKQKNAEKILANMKDGEFFGEMSMLYPAPRSASAVTIKPSKMIRFSDRDYNSFKKDHPDIVVKLNEIFIKILVQRLREADKRLVKEGLGIGAL